MILDHLSHAELYYGVGARFERGLRWLRDNDLASMAPERYEIAGDNVFAMVQEYDSKPMSDGFWEAHRAYADIQLVVAGHEQMGVAPIEQMQVGDYDESRDFVAVDGEGLFVPMSAGQFMILWPQDVHMPQMAAGTPSPVKKVVVKVKL